MLRSSVQGKFRSFPNSSPIRAQAISRFFWGLYHFLNAKS